MMVQKEVVERFSRRRANWTDERKIKAERHICTVNELLLCVWEKKMNKTAQNKTNKNEAPYAAACVCVCAKQQNWFFCGGGINHHGFSYFTPSIKKLQTKMLIQLNQMHAYCIQNHVIFKWNWHWIRNDNDTFDELYRILLLFFMLKVKVTKRCVKF